MAWTVTETKQEIAQNLTWLEISQGALERNLEKIKHAALPSSEALAVIKANAYGHGLLEVARVLEKKVTYFGVASLDEALKLRRFELSTPILLFGVHFQDHIAQAVQAEVALSVSSVEQAEMIEEAASRLRKPAVAHVKIDTGMGRLGIPLRSAKEAIFKIASLPSVRLEGIYTHFPVAEREHDHFTERQIRNFQRLLAEVGARGTSFAYRHAANSAGIFLHRSAHLNLIRPGISLYGIYPDSSLESKVSLETVLSWKARVILVKSLHPGESAGYGRTYLASEKTTIAILPVGYSYGYPVALSGKARVLIGGKSCPVAGRVSMDYLAVEIGKEHSVRVGDVATLLGKDGTEVVRAEELARLAGTVPYEIVTRIPQHIPRLLVD